MLLSNVHLRDQGASPSGQFQGCLPFVSKLDGSFMSLGGKKKTITFFRIRPACLVWLSPSILTPTKLKFQRNIFIIDRKRRKSCKMYVNFAKCFDQELKI